MAKKLPSEAVKKSTGARLLLVACLLVLLSVEGYFGYRLHVLSNQQEQIKKDYADVNTIAFGLLSVDEWRDKISGIINHQVKHFTLNAKQKGELQTEVQQIIYALINKAEALLNKKPKSLGGKIKKLAIKTFVNEDSIKAKVPALAKAIIAKIDNPENKNKLSTLAMGKFNQAQQSQHIDSSLSAKDSVMNRMYSKYHVSSPDELNSKLDSSLANIRIITYDYCFGMLGCVVIVLGFWWVLRKRVDLHGTLFIMSLLFAFILLAVGLTASMIEVDCRIGSLDFTILGQQAVFKNQVLFFQSKSILDVVEVLVKQPAVDSIAVGILILVFSILFPLMKLSSTGIHLLSKRKLAENRIVKYFAFQSGKWSMADVIVIAILMTYIGLNGLLDKQLAALNIKSDTLTLITTNNTALQPGYIIFISFVLYGLILSTILKSITPYDTH